MTWLLAIGLALAAFVAMVLLLGRPRRGWEAVAAALLLGIAGYGLQASPGLPGAPKPAQQTIAQDPAELVEARAAVRESAIPTNDKWIIIADALARNGQFANAAQVLQGAVESDPDNGEAWLAMANVLVAHADGLLTPAASFAFEKAAAADPDHPGPPFFLGLALAQSGQFAQGRQLWVDLLERSPDDAPWRADLEDRLQRLDRFMAAQQAAQPGQ